MMSHTPGPWQAVPHDIGGQQRWFIQFGPQNLATIASVNSCCMTYCNAENDARLIAAAPDLLAALEALLTAEIIYTGAITETLEKSQMHDDLAIPARAAIKKATGA